MRRIALAALLAAAFAPAADAAELTAAPRYFSPEVGRLLVQAELPAPSRVGVRLTTRGGRIVGWILEPSRRRFLTMRWNGSIAGKHVPDGRYLVRLMRGRRALVTRPVRIDTTPPELRRLRIGNGDRPFAGDGPLLTTVSPNGDGLRDRAIVRFRLSEPGLVTLEVTRTRTAPVPIFKYSRWFRAGSRAMYWKPPPTTNTRTYMLRLTTSDTARNRGLYGAETAWVGRYPRAPVVRIQGIDVGFTRPNYAPGQWATIRVATDAKKLMYQVFQSGPEREVVYADNQMAGVAVPGLQPVVLDWSRWRNRPHAIRFKVGNWPSGLYYVSFTTPTGRIGYALFVVRPEKLGRRAASRSSSPRTRGRRTTSGTETATGTATPGTRRARITASTSPAPTSRAERRRASTATTCRSCTGSTGRARTPSSSRIATSR